MWVLDSIALAVYQEYQKRTIGTMIIPNKITFSSFKGQTIEQRFNQLEQDIKAFADMKFSEVQESITQDFKQVREGLPLLFPVQFKDF